MPESAELGTDSENVKVHDPPAGKLPPDRLTVSVPDSVEPVPQLSFKGSPMADRPLRVSVKLSVKAISLIGFTVSRLVRV